ncbi:MAG: hypothetical protein KAT34_13270 [Candidatus Aminicenantes bacterium]|nr:hypothetical protein [Candidatus Aminicenantes bacterium]
MTFFKTIISAIMHGSSKKKLRLGFIILIIIPSILVFSQSSNVSDLKKEYQNLPPGLQARCALYKLNQLLEKLNQSGNAAKLQKYQQGRKWLETALKKYEDYVTPSNIGVTSPYERREKKDFLAEGYVGKGDPTKSPFGLMKHLWLAREGMMQRQATRKLSSGPSTLSPEEAKRYRLVLDKAVESIRKAVKTLEDARGWIEHSDGMFLSIKVPPGFRPYKNPKYRLDLTWRPPKSFEIEKVLFVSVEISEKDKYASDYQRKAVIRERKDHPDLVVIESGQHFPGVEGIWFTYGYTWKKKKLTGLIYHYKYGIFIWEVLYTALGNRFNEEECEDIIRSIQRK